MWKLRDKDRKLVKDPTPEEQEQRTQDAEEAELLKKLSFTNAEVGIKATAAKTAHDMVEAEAQAIENEVTIAGFDNIIFDKEKVDLKDGTFACGCEDNPWKECDSPPYDGIPGRCNEIAECTDIN